jgi:MFS family permease
MNERSRGVGAIDGHGLQRAAWDLSVQNRSGEINLDTRVELSAWRPCLSLAVLGCVGFLAYLDIQVFSVSLQQLKIDLHVTDTQFGLLMGALTGVFGAIASVPIGTLADRYDRKLVLAGSLLIWSIATVICGFAHDFLVLSAGAIATAMGESALVAIIYGMIPELFAPRLRPLANTLCYALMVLGNSLALYGAGSTLGIIEKIKPYWEITETLPSWRLAFGLAGLLGLPLCVLLLLVVPRKCQRLERSLPEGVARESMLSYLRQQGPFVISLMFWLAIYRFAASSAQFWMPTALVRDFHVSPRYAGLVLGKAGFLGTAAGVVIALLVVPRILQALGSKITPWIAATGCCMAALAGLSLMLTRSTASSLLPYAAVIGIITVTSSVMPGLLQDISRPHLRSSTFAIYGVISLGPRSLLYYGVGLYSGSGHDLKLSVAIVCGGALLAAAIAFTLMTRGYKRLLVQLG